MFSSQADLLKVYKNGKEESKSTTRFMAMQVIQNQETKITALPLIMLRSEELVGERKKRQREEKIVFIVTAT